jgi:hypothetical protein
MFPDLSSLIAILEAELEIGEALQKNIAEQRQAIIDWNLEALLKLVEQHQGLIEALGKSEERRTEVLASHASAGLSKLLTSIPTDTGEYRQLSDLRKRSLERFKRLLSDEEGLHALKNNVVGHLNHAIATTVERGGSVYGDTGRPLAQSVAPGLIYEKA